MAVLSAQAAAVQRSDGLLRVERLSAGYDKRQVVFDVSLTVGAGEIVTILGHNGAGKTTILKSVFGLLRPFSGLVHYDGRDIARESCARRVRAGMFFIPAEHPVFGDLNVLDNLKLGALSIPPGESADDRLNLVYEMFPLLQERSSQRAGTLSGGQQRVLSIGIALMAKPRLLLLDEPSLGLAPALVHHIMQTLAQLAVEESISILMLEQNVAQALAVAHRAYVVRSGRVILEESAEQMRSRGQWWDLF